MTDIENQIVEQIKDNNEITQELLDYEDLDCLRRVKNVLNKMAPGKKHELLDVSNIDYFLTFFSTTTPMNEVFAERKRLIMNNEKAIKSLDFSQHNNLIRDIINATEHNSGCFKIAPEEVYSMLQKLGFNNEFCHSITDCVPEKVISYLTSLDLDYTFEGNLITISSKELDDLVADSYDEDPRLMPNISYDLSTPILEENNIPFEKQGDNYILTANSMGLLLSALRYSPRFQSIRIKETLICMFSILSFKDDCYETLTPGLKPSEKKVEQAYRQNHLENYLSSVVKFYDIAENEINDLKKVIKVNNVILKLLKKGKLFDIEEIPKDWERYADTKTLILLTKELIKKQQETYNKASDESLTNLLTLNQSQVVYLMYQNGIHPDSIPKETLEALEKVDEKTLESRLNFLIRLDYDVKYIFLELSDFLLTLDKKTVDFITYLLQEKALKKETVISNLTSIKRLNNVKDNYDTLKPIIDFDNIHYRDDLLFLDLRSLQNRLSVIKEYNMTVNNYMYLLCHYEYLEIYDLMLEKDIPLYLFINICKTEEPLLTLKKIIICQEIGEPYQTETHLLKRNISLPNSFLCPDAEVDKYIENSTEKINIEGKNIKDITNTEYVTDLDRNYRHGDTYIIGNIKISRAKALKNLQFLNDKTLDYKETAILAMTSKSILSDYDVNILTSKLQEQKLS